jgi:hypothetical protein
MDVPAGVLRQLGLKIQHALRAFTAAEDLITQLGIGEALVTILNEKGIPTLLAQVMMLTPRSRMDILKDAEIDGISESFQISCKIQAGN